MQFLIRSLSNDVYFNLAIEDYLLHQSDANFLFLWQSEKAVVSGKHQNILGEINYEFCKNNKIQIARRLSGGGTVFQDAGNLNFCFIQNLKNDLSKAINYPHFLDPIKKALLQQGIETTYSTRHDLLFQEKKISGNAQHIDQKLKRVLHHGTLLLQSDLQNLGRALKPAGDYQSIAVKSVRSSVTNILSEANQIPNFIEKLKLYFLQQEGYQDYILTPTELSQIEDLKKIKYQTEKWIFNYSRKYAVRKHLNEHSTLSFEVENGQIHNVKISLAGAETAMPQWENKLINETNSALLSEELGINNPFILF